MVCLPQEFRKRMEKILGDEFPDFLDSYTQPHYRGVRLNSLKCSRKMLEQGLDIALSPTPFSSMSYYLPGSLQKPGLLPLYHAGAFYVQEPSAASAVTVLSPEPGERILDLCAAPGGKSTQIAALLQGKGLLWSNEVVRGRANILLSNIERMGVKNGVVSSCRPEVLCRTLAGFFDKVLVDAPCSGEGMFRRDERALEEWSQEHVASCALRQLAILNSAAEAVRENGVLVYSTCTFSLEENEGTVSMFLREHSDFVLENTGVAFGRPGIDMPFARRIFPMDGGEGHFVAKMRRISPNSSFHAPYEPEKLLEAKIGAEVYEEIFQESFSGVLGKSGDTLLILPEGMPNLRGLGVLRAGVPLGDLKAKRVEPAHGLWMASRPEQLKRVLNFPHDSQQIAAFLRGEELEAQGKGYTGVAVDGMLTGFGKCSGGCLKNRYPKGLRNH